MTDETPYVEDIDEFLNGLRLPEDKVPICMRMDLQAKFEDLERQLEAARLRRDDDSFVGGTGGSEARRIATEIEALRAEMQSHVRVFLLRARPRKEWRDLLAAHGPRPEDDPADHNRDTFPVAVLAKCSVKPRLTEEKAGRLIDALTPGQWGAMWEKLLALHGSSGTVPFSDLASGILSRSSRR